MEVSKELLQAIIKEVMVEFAGSAKEEIPKETDVSGVLCIKAKEVVCEPYDVGVPAKVALKDLVTLEESPNIGCGILEIDHSSYPWTLTYEEFYYVVDGILEIKIDDRSICGRSGDIIFIPKGSVIQFSSPETCRAIYFTYPADWENQ